jgi:hypothetical protein
LVFLLIIAGSGCLISADKPDDCDGDAATDTDDMDDVNDTHTVADTASNSTTACRPT